MNKNFLIGTVVVIVVIGGFIFLTNQKSQTTNIQTTQTGNNEEGKMVSGYNGKVLAGTTSPFLIYTKSDYDKALAANKIVVLDFYANWCPICREEAPALHAGFDSLKKDNVIGFRVNYNDTETDEEEKKLASEFRVTYQHTKIIVKNGKAISMSLESWDKETFLAQVNEALKK